MSGTCNLQAGCRNDYYDHFSNRRMSDPPVYFSPVRSVPILPSKTIVSSAYDPNLELPDNKLDPRYDYNFIRVKDDGAVLMRGGHRFFRPFGSYKYTFRILDKYEDNLWLTADGNPREWAIGYHATDIASVISIMKNDFDKTKIKRDIYAPDGKINAFYFTPSPEYSRDNYGKEFVAQGRRWKMIIQARINLNGADIHIFDDLQYWRVEDVNNIRPIGACIYPLD